MSKEKLIEEYLNLPPKVGESVYVRGLGSQNKDAFTSATEVIEVKDGGVVVISEYGHKKDIAPEDYNKNTMNIGENPFPKKPWNSRMKIVNFTLQSILHVCGFEDNDREYTTREGKKVIVPRLNWNPHFIGEDGNEVVYQRDFCWTLKDKQLLIESVYNNIDIGKMVIRKRGFHYAIERAGQGKETGFADIVDGKQRLNALIGFVSGEFEDLHGNKWEDLSDKAQHMFLDFQSIAYGEIGENATDEDVKSVFLGVNFSGVPMSQEHIDFVKSIKL